MDMNFTLDFANDPGYQWFADPNSQMGFNKEEMEFVEKHKLYFCTSYIGMLRVYYNNKNCIFQTSAFGPILDEIFNNNNTLKSYEETSIKMENDRSKIRKVAQEVVYKLMSMEEKELLHYLENAHHPLFG